MNKKKLQTTSLLQLLRPSPPDRCVCLAHRLLWLWIINCGKPHLRCTINDAMTKICTPTLFLDNGIPIDTLRYDTLYIYILLQLHISFSLAHSISLILCKNFSTTIIVKTISNVLSNIKCGRFQAIQQWCGYPVCMHQKAFWVQ